MEKRKRVAHILFKREKAKKGLDQYGEPFKPGPIILDMALGSWERAFERMKLLREWGYEVGMVEKKTNPSEDDLYSNSGVNLEHVYFS